MTGRDEKIQREGRETCVGYRKFGLVRELEGVKMSGKARKMCRG